MEKFSLMAATNSSTDDGMALNGECKFLDFVINEDPESHDWFHVYEDSTLEADMALQFDHELSCNNIGRQRTNIMKAFLFNKRYVTRLLQIKSMIMFIITGQLWFYDKIYSLPKKCNLISLCKIRKTCSTAIGHDHAF